MLHLQEYRSFGRRRGRKLRPYQAEIVRHCLPQLQVTLPDISTVKADTEQQISFNVGGLFANPEAPLHLEIGFGNGEYLWQRAQSQPQTNFLGAEPFEYGVAKLLMRIAEYYGQESPRNIRIYNDDVRQLLDTMLPASVDRVDIMFPDPWPKGRHHRRRLIQDALLQRLRRIMKPQAVLCIATDHVHYLLSILTLMQGTADFFWTAQSVEDWSQPWFGIRTRYAEKAERQGRCRYYLHYRYQ